jgi:UPF0755 protein
MKTLGLIVLSVLLVAAAGAAWVFTEERRLLDDPMNIGATSVNLVVESGSTLREVAAHLHEREILASPLGLVWFARWQDLSSKIKAGEYQVAANSTPKELLKQLIAGKVVQWSFTIIEGWTFKQLRTELATHDKIVHTLQAHDDAAVMTVLGAGDDHPEGWFYPDTYHFPSGTTDVEFLRRALKAMHVWLDEEWKKRAENLPFQEPYHALVLASIIERETAAVAERGDIAGVFVRRLRKGMKLEADPTVIYGLGDEFDGNLTRKHLKTDTPYNTYTRRGLPPTPIALPSGDAVRAALNPVEGETLFFVARGDGSGRHYFSVTYPEHEKAVQRYLKERKKTLSGQTQG